MPYNPALGTRPTDFNPEVFEPAGAGYGSQTQYSNIYDRPIPEQMTLFERHVGYTGFSDFLRYMGFVAGKSDPSTGHYEETWKDDTITIGSVVTPAAGAGNDIVIALDAADMYDPSVTSGGSARKASYPLVGDIIQALDGVQARVTAKDITTDPHRLTLTPILSTDDLDTSILATESYFLPTNLWGEGTEMPGMRAPRFARYQNTFGIVKTAWYSTGSELTNKIYHQTIVGDDGSRAIHVKVANDFMYYHNKSRDGLLLFGKQANNLTIDNQHIGIDVDIAGSEGFVPFARTAGTIDTYTAGSYALSDFKPVANTLEDERATKGVAICCWDGRDLHNEREDALQSFLSNDLSDFITKSFPNYGTYDFDAIADSNETFDSAYEFGIYGIYKYGFYFMFKKLPAFNDIKGAGATGYPYKAMGIYHPVEWTNDRRGNKMPIVGYEYKEMNGYSRELEANVMPGAGTGSFAGTRYVAHANDTYAEFLLSEIAGHWACGNKMVVQEAA